MRKSTYLFILAIIIFAISNTCYATEKKETVFVSYCDGVKIYRTDEVEKGSKVILEDPMPEPGYVFKGWEKSDEVDLNNVTKDVTLTQIWERVKDDRPVDPSDVFEQRKKQAEEEKELEELHSKNIKIRKTTPKVKINKKKKQMAVKTVKYATEACVFYSTKKTFQNYKSIKAEVKDGKAIIRLKKLKKRKTYYIKVQSRVVYNYKERTFVEYSKLTKTKKLKIKK